jgi:alkanesulfonate monooxygenase SsuD/methylene tetrahydromethanopterin reductase-like flavin-dependent oxidoreductase (luciferase family)
MTDYGQPPRFGFFLEPRADAPLIETAREAERRGLDLIGIQDHPYQRRFVDTFALMGTLLGRTERIGVFPDVANLPLRPPAVLAKTMASLDILSGGRVDLGLGAGSFWDAIEAYGGPRRTTGQARAALAEAIHIIRRLWGGERGIRFDGEHYRLAGAQSGPLPTRPIGIWLGVYGPKALELTGRVADGWVPSSPYLPPDVLLDRHKIIDAAAQAAGREPSAVRRVYNVSGQIGPSTGFLSGPADQWIDELTELAVGYGMDTFVFAGNVRDLPVYAEEIAPAVREQVTQERS